MTPRYPEAGSSAYNTRSYPGTLFSTMFNSERPRYAGICNSNVSGLNEDGLAPLLYNASLMRILSSRVAPRFVIAFFLLGLALATAPAPQQPSSNPLGGMRWRMIGPFRGGRSIAVSGIENQPNTYYFGSV